MSRGYIRMHFSENLNRRAVVGFTEAFRLVPEWRAM